MAKNLVIVESPAKARTIGKYLGRDYQVKASVGHIMDLPKNKLGVDVHNGFAAEYHVGCRGAEVEHPRLPVSAITHGMPCAGHRSQERGGSSAVKVKSDVEPSAAQPGNQAGTFPERWAGNYQTVDQRMILQDRSGKRLGNNGDFNRGTEVLERRQARGHKHGIAYGPKAYEQHPANSGPIHKSLRVLSLS